MPEKFTEGFTINDVYKKPWTLFHTEQDVSGPYTGTIKQKQKLYTICKKHKMVRILH